MNMEHMCHGMLLVVCCVTHSRNEPVGSSMQRQCTVSDSCTFNGRIVTSGGNDVAVIGF